MRRARLPTLTRAITALLASTTPAAAHLGAQEGLVPFFADDGDLHGAGTTFGLVFRDDDGAFHQVCEEAATDAIPVGFALLPPDSATGNRRALSISEGGLHHTDDDGCTWSAWPGSDTIDVVDFAVGADENDLWILSRDGHLLRLDTTRTAAPVDVASLTGRPLTLEVTLDEDRGVSGFVGGTSDGGGAALIRVRLAGDDVTVTDLRTTVEPLGPILDDALLARVLDVDDDAVFFSVLDGIGRGHLYRLARAPTGTSEDLVLLASADGVIASSVATSTARFFLAGTVTFVLPGGAAAATPARLDAPPLRCLIADGDALLGCGQPNSGGYFVRIDVDEAGATRAVQPLLPFAAVTPRTCPAGTPGEVRCRVAPTTPPPSGGGGVDGGGVDGSDDGDDDHGAGSGCQSLDAPTAGAPLLCLGLALRLAGPGLGMWRWRRRRRRHV